jgi:TolB-like protein/tetratricopeptide (TPR) repeat protein
MGPDVRHYEFGSYVLDVAERVLLRDGVPVRLQEKVLAVLLALLESHGRVVTKDALMSRVWPDVAVEENSLNKAVSAARKALGDGAVATRFIETVPKRGYRFVAPVRERGGDARPVGSVVREAPRSLAVLPFRLLGGGREGDYLGVGMADALITRLSNVRDLVVRPTSSVLRYGGGSGDTAAAGRELRVDSVLEGSIRRTRRRVRVTVQLVDVRDAAPVWAEKFDEDAADLFAVEDRVTERAARALATRMGAEERARTLSPHPRGSKEAYQLYLRGRYHAAKFTPAGLRKALSCFERAVSTDPGCALAHLGLAYYYFASCNEFSLPPQIALPRARQAAEAALRLDDTLGDAHLYLACVHHAFEWDWPRATRGLDRALAESPHSPVVLSYAGQAYVLMGQADRGLSLCRRAREVDPVSAEAITNLAIACLFAGRVDEAAEELAEAIDVDPHYWFAWLQLGRVHERQGRLDDAIAALRTAQRLCDSFPEVQAALSRAHALSGEGAKARAILRQLERRSRRSYVPAYHVATALVALGGTDEAFAWLEKAFEQRSTFLCWLATDPSLDPLRRHGRFAALMRRVGLWRVGPG